MSCFKPLDAWQVVDHHTGEVSITFKSIPHGVVGLKPLKLPCGQCGGCRLERSRKWAIRCMHEASLYDLNCFITLTYDDDNLPSDGSVHVKHFQDFMKRLRSRYDGKTIRFFHCGEYGSKLSRPHYHALLFNLDFEDKVLWKTSDGFSWYRSSILESLWTFGFSLVGAVTFESACYVARYITKKITGKGASAHYQGRSPEYITMSRRPGIGAGWYNKFKKDVYPSDEVIFNGHTISPPRFYDKMFDIEKPRVLEKIKERRIIRAQKFASEQSLSRRTTRSECLTLKLSKSKRSFEND